MIYPMFGVPSRALCPALPQVATVLVYASQNNVEPFLEPVLELCHTLMECDVAAVAAGQSDGGLVAVFVDQAAVFLELAAHPDANASSAALACVSDMLASYPAQCAPWLLSPLSLGILAGVLRGEQPGGGALPPVQLQQSVLEVVSKALDVPGSGAGPSNELMTLYEAVKHIAASGDHSIRSLATQVARGLGTV